MGRMDVIRKLKETGDYATTMWRIGRAFGAIIIGVLLIVAMTQLDDQYATLNERAVAEVIEIDGHMIDLEYEYEGETYTSKTIVTDASDYDIGDEVKVKFSENEPDVAVLTGKDQFNIYDTLGKIMMGVGGIFILVGVIRIIPNIKYLVSKLSDLTEKSDDDED